MRVGSDPERRSPTISADVVSVGSAGCGHARFLGDEDALQSTSVCARAARSFRCPASIVAVISLIGWLNRPNDTLASDLEAAPVDFASASGPVWLVSRKARPLVASRRHPPAPRGRVGPQGIKHAAGVRPPLINQGLWILRTIHSRRQPLDFDLQTWLGAKGFEQSGQVPVAATFSGLKRCETGAGARLSRCRRRLTPSNLAVPAAPPDSAQG
jgi:hypothetical protein